MTTTAEAASVPTIGHASEGFKRTVRVRMIHAFVGRRYRSQFMHGVTRAFVGERVADNLVIDKTLWRFVPSAISPVVNVASRVRYQIPGANDRQMKRDLVEIAALISANAEARGRTHDLVDRADSRP